MQSNRTVTPHNFYMDIIEMQFLAHIPGELYFRCQIFHALTVIIISHFYLTDCTIIASFIVVVIYIFFCLFLFLFVLLSQLFNFVRDIFRFCMFFFHLNSCLVALTSISNIKTYLTT